MKETPTPLTKRLFNLPLLILLVLEIVFYLLGLCLVRYLGRPISIGPSISGFMLVLLLGIGTTYLRDYFDIIEKSPEVRSATHPEQKPVTLLLVASMSCIAVAFLIGVNLFREGAIHGQGIILLSIGFIGAVLYAAPPLRLVYSGIGEFILAILLVNFIPAFAFLLQNLEMNRFLAMTTFPLTALSMAVMIAWQFPRYGEDCQNCRPVLLVRTGWQKGVLFHNLLITLAYVLLAIALFLGMPWRLVAPVLLTLPISIFEIWQLSQIAGGSKPRWGLLKTTSGALLLLWVYLFILTYWTI
jgi:1,4-dihydroxy-2-naphthoate octaprenyltransferase